MRVLEFEAQQAGSPVVVLFIFADDSPLNSGDALHNDIRHQLEQGLQTGQEALARTAVRWVNFHPLLTIKPAQPSGNSTGKAARDLKHAAQQQTAYF